MNKADEFYMSKAIELAKKAEGRTSPNPMVGAVLVKNGKIIGKGYHRKAGLAHAEVEVIRDAGENAAGATLYVTLEPCSTFGKTPPCTDLIRISGIKKVRIAAKDPNPVNANKGIRFLRKSGIEVETGILEKEAKAINIVFEKFIRTGLPFVTVKVAQSLDGKIATATGESKWITGLDSRRFVHKLRAEVDAVLVGINTVLKDDPLLTNRLYKRSRKQPIRIVLDSKLKISPECKLFSINSQDVILATTNSAPRKKIKFFKEIGVKILVAKDNNGKVDLKDLMKKLARMNIAHVLVEGGSEVLGSFFRENLVDRALFFISPKVIGGKGAPSSVMGEGITKLRFAKRLKETKITRFKEDILVEGRVN